MFNEVLTAFMLGLGAYTTSLGYAPFFMARSSLRMTVAGDSVRLSALDGYSMMLAGFLLSGPFFATIVAITHSFLVAGLSALLVWLSFRVKVVVTNRRTTVTRYLLFAVPWSHSSHDGVAEARAFVDGWGDFMDPEALHVELWHRGPSLELAWGDASSGEMCEQLARQFNLAVSALSPGSHPPDGGPYRSAYGEFVAR